MKILSLNFCVQLQVNLVTQNLLNTFFCTNTVAAFPTKAINMTMKVNTFLCEPSFLKRMLPLVNQNLLTWFNFVTSSESGVLLKLAR